MCYISWTYFHGELDDGSSEIDRSTIFIFENKRAFVFFSLDLGDAFLRRAGHNYERVLVREVHTFSEISWSFCP